MRVLGDEVGLWKQLGRLDSPSLTKRVPKTQTTIYDLQTIGIFTTPPTSIISITTTLLRPIFIHIYSPMTYGTVLEGRVIGRVSSVDLSKS